MAIVIPSVVHHMLPNGIELAVMPMPERSIVATEIRFFAGYIYEDNDRLGVAHVLSEAITKGTAQRNGRELNDAFDAIGATHSAYAGRETMGFQGICLPEFFEQWLRLHAEMICTPSLPDDACQIAVDLSQQSLAALEDDPHELARKLLYEQAYGDPLGRHVLGTKETLATIGRDAVHNHWQQLFVPKRMQVAIAGPVDPKLVDDLLNETFTGLPDTPTDDADTRPTMQVTFEAKQSHIDKDLEQEQIAICFPGARAQDPDFPAEKVVIGVLSGGMSGRLFTEVREKQGLVYWVGAHTDHPRNDGMMHLGASTTPHNVDKTYETLLREIDRLAEDVTDEEIQRAIVGLVAKTETRCDIPRVKATELANDLFYYGDLIPLEEKIRRVQAVTINDVKRYLHDHPRDRLSVVTLGPRKLGKDSE